MLLVRARLDVVDPAQLSVLADELRGDDVRDRSDLRVDGVDPGQLQEPHDLSLVSHEPSRPEPSVYRDLTVAHIRSREDADIVEVLFLESARVYKLPRDQPGFDRLLEGLREAEAEQRAVQIGLASLDSEIVEDVRAP